MDYIPFCFKLQGNEQVIVFLSIETHLIARSEVAREIGSS